MTNFSTQLIAENGEPATFKPIIDGEPQAEQPLTLKVAVKGALLNRTDAEGEITVENTVARYNLWQKIKDTDEAELTEDEKSLLKLALARRFEIEVAGQTINLI